MKSLHERNGDKVYVKPGGSKVKDKQDIANSFKDRQEDMFIPNQSKDRKHKYVVEHWFNKRTHFHGKETSYLIPRIQRIIQ